MFLYSSTPETIQDSSIPYASEGELIDLSWPINRLNECVSYLLERSTLIPGGLDIPFYKGDVNNDEALTSWLAQSVGSLGVECLPLSAHYPNLEKMLSQIGPALIRINVANENRFIVVLRGNTDMLSVIGPDLVQHKIPLYSVIDLLVKPITKNMPTDIDVSLRQAAIAPSRIFHARHALLRACLRTVPVEGCWVFRRSVSRGWFSILRQDDLLVRFGIFLGAYLLQLGLVLWGWSLIGRTTLLGNSSAQWIYVGVLAFITAIPLQLLSTLASGLITLDFGARLKQRLLQGALRLPDHAIQLDGIGRHLSRVIESETFESMLLSGAVISTSSLLQLIAAFVILAMNSSGAISAFLLVAWCVVGVAIGKNYYHSRRLWSKQRLEITHHLIERMIGHQTRLAHEDKNRWHAVEDNELNLYSSLATQMDKRSVNFLSLTARGWLIVGLAGLAPIFLSPQASTLELAVGIAGILLAYQAFAQLVIGAGNLIDGWISWSLIKPLFKAAQASDQAELKSSATTSLPTASIVPSVISHRESDQANPFIPLMEAKDLAFAYTGSTHEVFKNYKFSIFRGDRILLLGKSGVGKSTLAAILAGLQSPTTGLLSYRSLDQHTLKQIGWQHYVALAPQFHQNHIFAGSLAYNLLIGRRWPPSEQDLAEATALCYQLGLGKLLEQMPNGIHQMVGETGWQLSHGERSRVYFARAVLQPSEILIFDESFGALDPETLELCSEVLFSLKKTVILIAHP